MFWWKGGKVDKFFWWKGGMVERRKGEAAPKTSWEANTDKRNMTYKIQGIIGFGRKIMSVAPPFHPSPIRSKNGIL
ncbi:MAG: hypothetical protein Q8M98_00080 [Candidatus Cloacimonadaceae bacterium]|nr:hypothetical protein [Candidatus Cloacimonadaceae bacterium]MDP3113148.1 hypothetical protein [Candidatus Cloacimonadaceae bacterium]